MWRVESEPSGIPGLEVMRVVEMRPIWERDTTLYIGLRDGVRNGLDEYLHLSCEQRINKLFEELGVKWWVPEGLPEMEHVARRSRSIWGL